MVYRKALECKRTLKETQITSCALDKESKPTDEALIGIAKSIERSVKDDRFLGVINISKQGADTSIPNMCMLSDGSFCLAQFSDSQIIKIDDNLKLSDTFTTKSNVWGICAISEREIAFTMPKLMKVQFLVFDTNPVLKSSFCTNMHCRGIAYCNDNMYVAGGGFLGEESGQINIFDLKGKLLYRFENYSDGPFVNIPRSVIANTKYIYITDCQNGVICLDLHGKRHWVLKNAKCEYPWGICFTPNANILIAGHKSNNISVVSEDGELLGELLDKNDGISVTEGCQH
ncbi:uncharacterized protein LOC123529621 isoform X1 [Mercenaria mercenaria]|uniref:uncharacterized protein LOC123529621 isoform X1 n=1 Tax=Mercenaria mercenaria TaxID=6596 RepID=UPI00234F5CC9|nr:uncharacterized protein LOC123529621 isoform X1 [Mercenaria mercenaria]